MVGHLRYLKSSQHSPRFGGLRLTYTMVCTIAMLEVDDSRPIVGLVLDKSTRGAGRCLSNVDVRVHCKIERILPQLLSASMGQTIFDSAYPSNDLVNMGGDSTRRDERIETLCHKLRAREPK
jgi:hypothetical protein